MFFRIKRLVFKYIMVVCGILDKPFLAIGMRVHMLISLFAADDIEDYRDKMNMRSRVNRDEYHSCVLFIRHITFVIVIFMILFKLDNLGKI